MKLIGKSKQELKIMLDKLPHGKGMTLYQRRLLQVNRNRIRSALCECRLCADATIFATLQDGTQDPRGCYLKKCPYEEHYLSDEYERNEEMYRELILILLRN